MKSQDASASLQGQFLILAHIAWYVCALLVVIILLGAFPGYYSHYVQAISFDPYGLGQFNRPFQILVGVGYLESDYSSFALALLLFWRKRNERIALFASFLFLITAVAGFNSLDYFLTVYFGAPPTAELGSVLQTPLWILVFAIFPDGRFVPRWTRWIFLVSIPASFAIFAGAEVFAIANVVTYPLFFLVIYAQVYRYRHVSSYAERKQTKWIVLSFVVSLGLSLIASLIYKRFSPPLLNIFPLAFAIAILQSGLWDIDIIIRKTLTYSALTAVLAFIYLLIIIVLQRVFSALTGTSQTEVVTVVSTLAIAALFNPLRKRIQDFLDRRFYRRKYDAQQVLAQFAKTARDETDIDKLTNELVRVVDETMQPESVELWLKKTDEHSPQRRRGS